MPSLGLLLDRSSVEFSECKLVEGLVGGVVAVTVLPQQQQVGTVGMFFVNLSSELPLLFEAPHPHPLGGTRRLGRRQRRRRRCLCSFARQKTACLIVG